MDNQDHKSEGQPSVENLIKDKSFVEYCLGSAAGAIAKWEKYITDHPEQLEIINQAKRRVDFLFGKLPPEFIENKLTDFKALFYHHKQANGDQ